MTAPLRWAVAASPLGPLAVCVSERGVRALTVADDEASLERALDRQFPSQRLVRDQDGLAGAVEQLDKLWHGRSGTPDLELDPEGTPFQQSVWAELRRIPYGSTITYGELAGRVGNPKAVRAAAKACGANPILLLIPCHRVVGADGSLTGFAAGIERKRWLLERESPPLE